MRRMYSKKQLEELISKLSGDLIEVTNIKQLSDEECDGLKVGDMVAKKTGKQYHCYIVTFKQDKGGLCLSYFDASCIETQSYDYTGGHWVYNSEDKTDFSQIGGGLPEVTAVDNGKVLEVIAGIWGKGGKKVNVIDAPASTTLTEEEYNLITSGVFINGTFLGFTNPILMPPTNNVGAIIGSIIGSQYTIAAYEINPTTRQISLNYTDITPRIIATTGNLELSAGYYGSIKVGTSGVFVNNRLSPQKEVALTNLGTITSTETASGSGFYKNEIPYTTGIGVEDVVNVKMSNGAVYQAFNDTTNSKLVIYTGVDFASNSIEVSKCWKLAY